MSILLDVISQHTHTEREREKEKKMNSEGMSYLSETYQSRKMYTLCYPQRSDAGTNLCCLFVFHVVFYMALTPRYLENVRKIVTRGKYKGFLQFLNLCGRHYCKLSILSPVG